MSRGKIIFVTGGARSGKSSFAEALTARLGEKVAYIATSVPCDDEMKQRILRHKAGRPKNWSTFETFENVDKVMCELKGKVDVVLLDCITVMISNLMLKADIDYDTCDIETINSVEKQIKVQIENMLDAAEKISADVVIVSNELGMGLVPEYRLGRVFRDIAGRMNQIIAQRAQDVYLLVSGIPINIKKDGRKIV